LGRHDVDTALLAGGTVLNAGLAGAPAEVVDLQSLGLDGVSLRGSHMTVGSMVRLRDLIDHPATPRLVTEAAQREGPNTFRNAATVGGVVASRDRESELLAALLVHEALVSVAGPDGSEDQPLETVLGAPGELSGGVITEISIATDGIGHIERTGRTPADRSIVAAVGRRTEGGLVWLAMTGVAPVPVLVDDPDDLQHEPPEDFRGSSEYRRELAGILGARALDFLGEAS
ncbi:MAG: FAD binding domain-containing protein, partial [Actinomycetota bacterium]|nr:FAD binding domain-containing protein [Actinomycetota bacterium]